MLDALATLAQVALYAGVLCACGSVFAAATLRAETAAADALSSLARGGAVLTIIATLGSAIVLNKRLAGNFDEATISALLMSSVGAAAGMRLSGAALLLMTSADQDDSFVRGMRLSYAALIAASFVFSGHAAAAGFGAGLVASVHISVAGWWIASLVAIARACAASGPSSASRIVQRFSALAVTAIAALVLAGIILILALIALPVLTVTPYLVTLAVKIGIALLIFALAAFNKFRLTPRVLAGEVSALRALRTAIHLELALLGLVLIATALLTTYNAPEEEGVSGEALARASATGLESSGLEGW